MGLTTEQQIDKLNDMISLWSKWMTDRITSAALYASPKTPRKIEIYAKCIERCSQRIIKIIQNG